MSMQSREIRLAARPKGEPRQDDFTFANVELKNPGVGEVLVKNLYFSVDPYMRGRMNDAKSYVSPFVIGKPMEGSAVGVVAASKDNPLPVGSLVLSMFGWREAFVAQARILQRLDASIAPPSTFLGLLGITGLTAWVGLWKIARLQPGETVFVSGGAGAVGSAACQLAKLHDCKVIASAGSDAKVKMLRDELGADFAFNYKDGDPLDHLKAAAPDGIHVYFDNTGGPQLEAALGALKERGRVALCGAIAGYNTPVPGPRNLANVIGKRLRLEGFIVSDFLGSLQEFLADVVPAFKSGKIKSHETVVEGIDQAPAAFISLLHSGDSHIGKLVIHLAD
jgi:NADPH-dependent curcumin reductase CurA